MIGEVKSLYDIGLKRENNQDSIYFNNDKDYGIFVVADGMGGYEDGEIASKSIVSEIEPWWLLLLQEKEQYDVEDVMQLCIKKLQELNHNIFLDFKLRGSFGGSTVTVLVVWKEKYAVLHVGDSRAYRINSGKVEALTKDDVWDNLESTRLEFSEEEIEINPNKGKLTASMGAFETTNVHSVISDTKPDDIFLLCSDGVYKYCNEEILQKIFSKKRLFRKGLQVKLDEMETIIRSNGAADNYSAILCEIK